MSERKSTIKEDLAEIKLVIAIMKKQIKQLEDNLGIVMPARIGYTDDDYREIINTRKRK